MNHRLSYRSFGDAVVLVEWSKEVNPYILQDILAFQSAVQSRLGDEILEIVNTYNGLTIFTKGPSSQHELIDHLRETERDGYAIDTVIGRSWSIPVCYDLSFGLDLSEISDSLDLEIDEILRIHSEGQYLLYFMGFLPGFMYLGGLDERLFFPRKSKPRTKIGKGDVGIAGEQTGIYPNDSPGGWNIIGRTPVNLFDPNIDIPCFTRPGDMISFKPISLEEYSYLKDQITHQEFDVNSLLKNG